MGATKGEDMLKKLAKYGNSTTLVIDKAILELLNMDESSMVKLQTDGKSLTITPVANNENKKVSYEGYEALVVANQAYHKRVAHQELDPEAVKVAQKDFHDVFVRHGEAFNRFNKEILLSKDFQEALSQLSEKIDPMSQSEEYIKEFNNLRIKFCPELAGLQQDLEAVSKKYNALPK
jgi:antitoxin component of MazEF toxin-antitoxin module